MGSKSRRKGKLGELQACKIIEQSLGVKMSRTRQASGLIDPDIRGVDRVHFEVKRYKSIGACRFYEQAMKDAPLHNIPVVLMREDKGPWLIMMRVDQLSGFNYLIRQAQEQLNGRSPIQSVAKATQSQDTRGTDESADDGT